MLKKVSKKEFIAQRRAEIKAELEEFLEKNNHTMTAEEIIDEVFHDAADEDDFESYVPMLIGDEPTSCEIAQEIAMDLFNYFPRKSLGGSSFADKVDYDKLLEMAEPAIISPYMKKSSLAMKIASKNDFYYDAMDAMNSGDNVTAVKLLKEALGLDPNYVQTHHGLSAIYRDMGNLKKYREHTLKAFEETKRIFKKWPKELSWYDIDNRQYHRAIFFRAGLHVEEGEVEEGIELYSLLLNMWPTDSLGIRYYLAGLYSGKSMEEIEEMWAKCNENQTWSRMDKMVEIQNKKHHFWKRPKSD